MARTELTEATSLLTTARSCSWAPPVRALRSRQRKSDLDSVLTRSLIILVASAPLAFPQAQGTRIPDADWPRMHRDLAGTKYSPLAQINTKNVGSLKEAGSYKLRPERETAEPQGAAYLGL